MRYSIAKLEEEKNKAEQFLDDLISIKEQVGFEEECWKITISELEKKIEDYTRSINRLRKSYKNDSNNKT